MFLSPSEENIEAFRLDQHQQRAVLDAAPSHTDHGVNFMPRQQPGELVRHVFVEQNLQGCA
jgi:hypothetical protein